MENSASNLTRFTPVLNLWILVKMCETVVHSDVQIEGQLLLEILPYTISDATSWTENKMGHCYEQRKMAGWKNK